ncbi:MAG: hypothetical protein MUE95_04075 [Cyclobacteriaceae bacterium]|jgi:uncharacterized membrane protein YphA (DoxX/SURF4 family)|nr:hypothetical protein [Cyclobacteriaceae bacterium]
MRGLDTFLLPYIASQIISVIILYVAFRNTRLARLLFALMFLYAGCYNMYIGFAKPDEYQGFAELALPLYRDFINGWFSSYNYLLIPLIALGQLGIGLGMVLQDQWVQLACIGAIIFLLSIAPLMVGSAFPFSLTVSFALLLILRNDDMNVLWGPEERS